MRIVAVLFGTALIAVSVDAIAGDPLLSLRHGLYVNADDLCQDPPNADVLFWDGTGLSGAHSSRCTSSVQPREHGQLEVRTTCAAQGDGTKSLTPGAVDTMVLKRVAQTRFVVIGPESARRAYRWCGIRRPQ